jgi:2-(3-amino-3-carboxypropyl)histidine synthase
MDIEYVPYIDGKKLAKGFLGKVLRSLSKYERVGVCYVIQNRRQAEQAYEFLKMHKKTVMVGQVLGCNLDNVSKARDKVDAFLLVGSGRFHGIGIGKSSGKPVFVAEPPGNVFEISKEEVLKQERIRQSFLFDFEKARNIGLLVSTKRGQFNLKKALEAKKVLEESGKKPYVFLFETLVPEELLNFGKIDFWINFACPRIEGDYLRFGKPVLNWEDVEEKCC